MWVPTIDPKYRDISADLGHDATSLGQLIVEIQNVQNPYDMPCMKYLNSCIYLISMLNVGKKTIHGMVWVILFY